MVFKEKLVRVGLPHLDPKRWKKLQDLYQKLQDIQDSKTLVTVLMKIYQESGHSLKEFYASQNDETASEAVASDSNMPFNGLQTFLDHVLTKSEKTVFYEKTLPFIAILASKLDEHAPAEEIFVSCQQKPCSISLDRKFLASILASGFLCALPENNISIATITINFDHLFANFHRSELKDIHSAKLRCLLCYFERLASSNFDLLGELIVERQVVDKSSLPSLADWTRCNTHLSPLIIEHHQKIVDSDPCLLQVDFSGCFIDGKLQFYTSPEILVAAMFMESVEDNESLIIKGAERFSILDTNSKGVVQFAGDFLDVTERDICGNLQKAVASIGANKDCDKQYKEGLILKFLNKALVCFCQGTPCELIKMSDIDGMNGFEESMSKEELGQERYKNGKDGRDEEVAVGEDSGIMYVDDQATSINGNVQTDEINQFCVSLVSRAYNQAQDEIKCKSQISFVHSEDTREMLEILMKKSVHEVFKSSPEKERKYEEKILNSPLIPKCMLQSRDFNDYESPLAPSTPPSSPTKRSLVTSGNQSPISCVSPPSTLLSKEVRLGTTSFADSLADSLMSCVMLSSSLATSIATLASTPLKITSVAMETLQESPVKKGHQILSSFLSPKSKLVETSLVNEETEFGLIDLSTEDDVGLDSISYLDETSEEENEARRKSLTELAVNLFEDFASKLASSIINSATGLICEDRVLECIDEEDDEDDDDSSNNNSSNNNSDSSDFVCDGENNPNEDQEESNNDGEHENEASNDKNKDGANHDKDPLSTDSDSEEDSAPTPWEDPDIDKELEDKFYELDLTDNEYISNDDHLECVTKMANKMVKDILCYAYPKATRELEEKAELYGFGEQSPELAIENKTELVDIDSRSSLFSEELFRARENGFSSELLHEYARDLSTKVVQEALSKSSSESFHEEEILLVSLGTQKVDGEEENSNLVKALYQENGVELLNENENVEEIGEEELNTGHINSKMCKSDRYISVSEECLTEFAQVLSKQLLETSMAIAGASILLKDESLSFRPIATGSWFCGGFEEDPQLEAIVQWLAASAAGCPAMVYYTSGDARLEKFSKVQQTLRQRDCRVRDVMNSMLRYYQQDNASIAKRSSLFEQLLEECHAS